MTARELALMTVVMAIGCQRVIVLGCKLGNVGDACETTIDCVQGLVCAPGSGICISPPDSGGTCVADLLSCAEGEPCCGSCIANQCTGLLGCGLAGVPCASDAPCCTDQHCSEAGFCEPSCGGYGAACSVEDGGCCVGRGLVCLSEGSCGLVTSALPCSDVACAVGGVEQCTLGASCDGLACQSAGLTCDPLGFCRLPLLGETCQPGGPVCQPPGGSTVVLVCDPQSLPPSCVQPCQHNTDCIAIDEECDKDPDSLHCIPAGCMPVFSQCLLGGSGDGFPGVCLPNSLSSAIGTCQQVNDAAVVAGDPCDLDATKQHGMLCGPDTICVGGICSPICSYGIQNVLQCATTNCRPYAGASAGSDYGTGFCSIDCDFTDPDGGECGVQGKPPQKCVPGPDGGICVALLADAGVLGSACDPTASVDPCVAGASCSGPLTDGGGIQFRCLQLCRPGTNDACSSGSSCSGDGNAGHCQ